MEAIERSGENNSATDRPTLRVEETPRARSLREQMLSARRGRLVPVDMSRYPDWPQSLFVKAPSSAAIAAWEQSGITFGKKGRAQIKPSPTRKAELIQLTLCDSEGVLVFSPKDVQDVAKLDADVVNHLFAAARKVSGQDVVDDDEEDEDEGN